MSQPTYGAQDASASNAAAVQPLAPPAANDSLRLEAPGRRRTHLDYRGAADGPGRP